MMVAELRQPSQASFEVPHSKLFKVRLGAPNRTDLYPDLAAVLEAFHRKGETDMTSTGQPITEKLPMTSLEALNRLINITFGFAVSQTFFTACTLGVFEELSHGPATAEEVSQRINLPLLACRRLLMALKNLGLVERQDSAFRNSELGSFCTSKSSVNLAALAGIANPFYHMFEFLPDALRELSPRWQQALGANSEDVFGSLYQDPVRLRQFTAMMNAHSIPLGQEIARVFDFTPYQCVMDVAGGPGGIVVQIGLRYPHLRGIVMDLGPICTVAQEYIQANGLSGRFTTAAADLVTGPYPHGADVVVLGWILHDWSDDTCHQILRNCFDALPSGGVLLVCEKVLNDDFSGTTWTHMLDMVMMVACESGARERTEAEYRSLLEEAGFRDMKVQRLQTTRDLIIARKL